MFEVVARGRPPTVGRVLELEHSRRRELHLDHPGVGAATVHGSLSTSRRSNVVGGRWSDGRLGTPRRTFDRPHNHNRGQGDEDDEDEPPPAHPV